MANKGKYKNKSRIIDKGIEMKLNKKKIAEIFGVILITLGALIFIGLLSTSSTGKFGKIVQFIYSMSFGNKISFLIPIYLFVEGFLIFREKPILLQLKSFLIFVIIGVISSSSIGLYQFGEDSKFFINRVSDHGDLLGSTGFYTSRFLNKMFGHVGSYTFLSGIALILLMYVFDFRVMQMLNALAYPFIFVYNFLAKSYKKFRVNLHKKKIDKDMKENSIEIQDSVENPVIEHEKINDENSIETTNEQDDPNKKKVDEEKPPPVDTEKLKDIKIEEAVIEKEVDFKKQRVKEYKYDPPSINLLNESKININIIENEEKLRDNAAILISKLQEFSLEAEVVQINPGPVITQYEIKLASGVKVAKVSSLENDLAMALRAKSIRIVAPIPGKGTVGIEIPNSKPSIVYLKSIINSEKFINHKSKLAIALGKLISGENYILDLAKTPHLLIAGSTGSGKSVCINGLIISLLYRATPEEVQFCMIDPKRVELSVYSSLLKHHLIKLEGIDEPVVTNPEDAVRMLEALVKEMEDRYQILQQSGTRNLEEYNKLVNSGNLKTNELSKEKIPFKKMPYIVCIMDEYGDLMMTSGKAVEDPICRLAQMARAIGIHMVLATQRPSVKVVTGAIKANFPTRIAFRVMSQIDSRTILDGKGAESLLGKGDMLLVPPGESDLVRIQ
ncbi:MAG: DNA translocase FtsK, partial [Candidatus Delongbacteria bacterium]|nr:DNA translocase FtsK [Candidatus Delongbacteria bacterium]